MQTPAMGIQIGACVPCAARVPANHMSALPSMAMQSAKQYFSTMLTGRSRAASLTHSAAMSGAMAMTNAALNDENHATGTTHGPTARSTERSMKSDQLPNIWNQPVLNVHMNPAQTSTSALRKVVSLTGGCFWGAACSSARLRPPIPLSQRGDKNRYKLNATAIP